MAAVLSAQCFYLDNTTRILKEVCAYQFETNNIQTLHVKYDKDLDLHSLDAKTIYTNNYLSNNIHKIPWKEGYISLNSTLEMMFNMCVGRPMFLKGDEICQYFADKYPSAEVYNLDKLGCPTPDKIETSTDGCYLFYHTADFRYCAQVIAKKLAFWLKNNKYQFTCDQGCRCEGHFANHGWCTKKLKIGRVYNQFREISW